MSGVAISKNELYAVLLAVGAANGQLAMGRRTDREKKMVDANVAQRLIDGGFLEFFEKDKRAYLRLTDKGRKTYARLLS